MEAETSTASRRSSLASADLEPNNSSTARRPSLETSSASKTPRDFASTPSPQLSFGSKRRRSKQITPLPLDLGSSSMPVETTGNSGVENVASGRPSKTSASGTNDTNPNSSNSIARRSSLHRPSTAQRAQDDSDDEDVAQGQVPPRKLRRVASQEKDGSEETNYSHTLARTRSRIGKSRDTATSLQLSSSGLREGSPLSRGVRRDGGRSEMQGSHSRSLSDPQAEHTAAVNEVRDESYPSQESSICQSQAGVDALMPSQESNYTWQASSGPMSIASMSNFKPEINSTPTSPQDGRRSEPSPGSELDAAAPPYFPGSQRAVAAVGGSPTLSNSQPLIHPSLAGLPGTGGGPGSKQQPSFVIKLYSMLEDSTNQDMIRWGSAGQLFNVSSPSEFSKHILPKWFKHSNWQSFVRQLNMYGFHKVSQNQATTPLAGEENQVWEFKHPSFRRGAIHLLADIKRKSSRPGKGQQNASPTYTSVPEDNESRTDLEQSVGAISPSPQFSSQAITPGTMSSNFAFPPRRSESGQLSDSRAFPHQRERPASHNGSHSRFSSAAGSAEGSGLPVPQSSMGRTRAGTDAHTNLYNPSSPSSSINLTTQNNLHHQETAESFIKQGTEGSSIRVDDLSDRIDAVIRHASYLETQLRNVSEQLFHSQQIEQATRSHSLRMLNRLTNVCSSWCSTDAREGSENRRLMLEACHEEMAGLHSLLEIEPGMLSPPITPAALPGLHLPSKSLHPIASLGASGRDTRGEWGRDSVGVSPRTRPEGVYSTQASPSTSRLPPPPPPRTSSSNQVPPSFPFSQPNNRR